MDKTPASDHDGDAVSAPGQGSVERLTTADCWVLLEQAGLGRLAVVNVDGTPDIFPVNYVPHEGSLFIRTARDSKLLHIAHHPAVAFEVDGETDDRRWSVVVRGTAERVTRDDEIRRSGVREMASWSPTDKHFVIKVTANTVTGRRFRKDAGHADRLVAFEGSSALGSQAPQGDSDQTQHPFPIPHRSPLSETGQIPTAPPDGA